jgi:hypothetical protein
MRQIGAEGKSKSLQLLCLAEFKRSHTEAEG